MGERTDIFGTLLQAAEQLGKVESAHFYGSFCTVEGKGAAGRFYLTLTVEADNG